MSEHFVAHKLKKWAETNMGGWEYGYEKIWFSPSNHLNTSLQLFKHDYAFWIIVGAAPEGYGANEKAWTRANLGTVVNVSEVEPIFKAMEETASIKFGEREWDKKK